MHMISRVNLSRNISPLFWIRQRLNILNSVRNKQLIHSTITPYPPKSVGAVLSISERQRMLWSDNMDSNLRIETDFNGATFV